MRPGLTIEQLMVSTSSAVAFVSQQSCSRPLTTDSDYLDDPEVICVSLITKGPVRNACTCISTACADQDLIGLLL